MTNREKQCLRKHLKAMLEILEGDKPSKESPEQRFERILATGQRLKKHEL